MMTKCNFLPREMANDSYTERGEEEREGEREKEDVNWWVEAIKGGNFDQRTFYPFISFKFFFPTFVYSFQNYFWNHVLGTNRSKMFKIYIFFNRYLTSHWLNTCHEFLSISNIFVYRFFFWYTYCDEEKLNTWIDLWFCSLGPHVFVRYSFDNFNN